MRCTGSVLFLYRLEVNTASAAFLLVAAVGVMSADKA
jgi:hypothetical protein